MPALLAEEGTERRHRPRFCQLLESADGRVRIASPYITNRSLLIGAQNHENLVDDNPCRQWISRRGRCPLRRCAHSLNQE